MNNRFRFRGFHPVLAEVQEIKFIDFIHNTVDFGDGDIFNIEDVKIQQCTGIKDKNGKLIYEGDIVSYHNKKHYYYIYLYKGNVGFYHGDCVMQYILSKNFEDPINSALYNLWDEEDVEIMGNIYENAELLTLEDF